MEKLTIWIDEKSYSVKKGKTLLEICREHDIFIPTLCYLPGTSSFAGCRLCLVEIRDGDWYKLVASCEYPVLKSQHFFTHSKKVINSRRLSGELLLARVPKAKELLEDILQQPLEGIFEPTISDNDSCLLCGLCYRACTTFGPAAISANGRGAMKVVGTPYNEQNPDCVACGICASICPTNAIKMVETDTSREIWQQRSDLIICPSCGKRHITQKTYDFLVEELKLPAKEMMLCDACRKKTLAQELQRCFVRRA